jgi:hypothetical protein
MLSLLRLRLSPKQVQSQRPVLLLPLHGALSPQEQKQVFFPFDKQHPGVARGSSGGTSNAGGLKIVLATNIAEASITLPDVTVVIDCCRVKQVGIDLELGMTQMQTQLAAQVMSVLHYKFASFFPVEFASSSHAEDLCAKSPSYTSYIFIFIFSILFCLSFYFIFCVSTLLST